MSNHVIMFQPWLARKVEDGSKLTTIRGNRKRPIKVGDTLSLREWTGKPYRSKIRVIRTVICSKVERIEMTAGHFFPWSFGLPFTGVRIHWENPNA